MAAVATGLLLGAVAAQPAAAAKPPAACRGAGNGDGLEQPAAELPGTLEAPVLSSYHVFARPQVPADLLPQVNTSGLALEFRMSSYYPGEIRQLLAMPNGRRFVAVPGFLRTAEIPPAICLPKVLRKHRAQLVKEEARRRTSPAYCITEVGSRRFLGGTECALFSEAAESRNVFEAGPGSDAVVAIVPDGVSSARVVYPNGPPVVAGVRENAYLLSVPAAILREQRKLERQVNKLHFPRHPTRAQQRALSRKLERIFRRLRAKTEPVRVEWLAADGTTVKRISRPPEGGAARLVILGALF